jgi:hypothetical protein
MGVLIALNDTDFSIHFGYTSDMGLLGHLVVIFFNFRQSSMLFPILAVSIYIPRVQEFTFLHILIYVCYLLSL